MRGIGMPLFIVLICMTRSPRSTRSLRDDESVRGEDIHNSVPQKISWG